jgi:hypothetical protein
MNMQNDSKFGSWWKRNVLKLILAEQVIFCLAPTLCLADGDSFSDRQTRRAPAQYLNPQEEVQAACQLHSQMAGYPRQSRIQKLIQTGYANPRGAMYFCYRHIKKVLDIAGLVTDVGDVGDTREEQIYARLADIALADHGFVNILKCPAAKFLTPEEAPPGAILVYEPKVPFDRRVKNANNLNAGDIQLKLSQNAYLNYGIQNKSFLKNNNGSNANFFRLKAILLLK